MVISSPPVRILRLNEVLERTGLRRSTLYDQIRKGTFPPQISLGARSVGWVEQDIVRWITSCMEKVRVRHHS